MFLLDRILNRFLAKQHSDRLIRVGPMLRLLFVRLPFMGVLSKRIQTRLNLMIMRVAHFIKLHVVYYNRCTIRSLFKNSLRTNIPVLQRSNVIYMMRCSDCSACYIGKTKRKLRTRVCEHRTALKGIGLSRKAEQSLRAGHMIDWTNVEVIGFDCSDIRLLYKETYLIKKHKPTMNNYVSSKSLNVFI